MTRVADRHHLPASVVERWSQDDLGSAVTDILNEVERCPGCGLQDDQKQHVEATLSRCPTCEDRDRKLAKIKPESSQGMRVRFSHISDPAEAAMFSSWAKFTKAGKDLAKRVRAATRDGG